VEVAVVGLWHLGAVTAAALASRGHTVVATDEDADLVWALAAGRPAVDEPGLAQLVADGCRSGRLRLEPDLDRALAGCEALVIAVDTPVDHEDRADVEAVVAAATRAIDALRAPAALVVASQVPVGSVHRIADAAEARHPGRLRAVAHLPENLRLGRAVADALAPDHVVVGADDDAGREVGGRLVPDGVPVAWVSIRSAELAKAARNAMLATTVALANELAVVAERVGADGAEVAAVLRLDPRIGPAAYVSPGAPFSGGTLARDAVGLVAVADRLGAGAQVLRAALAANADHADWPLRAAAEAGVDLDGAVVAVVGLTYKPGTETLRRSGPIELCRRLLARGAKVRAWHPALTPDGSRPAALPREVRWCPDLAEALSDADLVVVATPIAGARVPNGDELVRLLRRPLVIDPAGAWSHLREDPRVAHRAVGHPGPHGGAAPC
jgi:UDPglucose 6-dehydrogenase